MGQEEKQAQDLDKPGKLGEMVSTKCSRPTACVLKGDHCDLVPLDPRAHGDQLYELSCMPGEEERYKYLFVGPFASRDEFDNDLNLKSTSECEEFFVVMDKASRGPVGYFALMNIVPEHGRCEVGHVTFMPPLQGTVSSTEAQYLLAKYVFETMSYRRYEWKCHSFNVPSRRAAERLGFQFEGTFRQHIITKGRNRDTAWFSMLDSEWPCAKAAFQSWLAPENFDHEGRQKRSLADIRLGAAQVLK